MINAIGQVMLYVDDQQQAKRFWTEKVGFIAIAEDSGEAGGFPWIEIAAAPGAQTTFVLQNKKLVAEMAPELNLGTPSIMLYTPDVEALYEDFKAQGITVGELVDIPGGRVFNFADDESNYFAVMEKK